MPRSLEEIMAAQDELADAFERAEPTGHALTTEEILARRRLRAASREMSSVHALLAEAVSTARGQHLSWKAIGDELGTSGEAARQRFARLVEEVSVPKADRDNEAPKSKVADDRLLAYYLAELTTQSQYAAIAAEHLNAAYEARPGPSSDPGLTRSFAAIQSLLGAAAIVSKLLWSAGGPRARQRARQLRDALSVQDDDLQLLRGRAARDSLEHVDERIDGYLAGRRPSLDQEAFGSHPQLHGGPSYLRRIDPARGVVEVMGRAGDFEQVHVNDLVDEMLDVQRRVNAWFDEHANAGRIAEPNDQTRCQQKSPGR